MTDLQAVALDQAEQLGRYEKILAELAAILCPTQRDGDGFPTVILHDWGALPIILRERLAEEHHLTTDRMLLRMAVEIARDELDLWGYGDFHYGPTPREPQVLATLWVLDAALGRPAETEVVEDAVETPY